MRRASAFAAATLVLILAVALAPASATRTSGQADPRLEITRKADGQYVARLSFEAETEVGVKIGIRLLGKPLDGKRETVAAETAELSAGPGRVRESAPFPGAVASCFAYVRCRLSATGTIQTPEGEPAGSATAVKRVPTGRPQIRERHIPYGSKRRKQMASYSKRHYGARAWRLEPRGIVEHYTATRTAGPALNYFASNRPDVEYGELPGVCAHYLIDRDGTILELVRTDIRCRHTVGLNHETIGIEHVGQSDGDVLGRPRVLRSSLALTSWLRCAYAIQRSNVIGHNESLGSPLYEELDPDFRGRTHADMKPATMRRYRRKLEDC